MSDLSPQVSPLRPASGICRRKYEQFQLDHAHKLALSDGVRYASEQTGVSIASIYKLLKPQKPIQRKSRTSKPKAERPEKAFAATPLFQKAVALGEFFHANVPGDSKRNAFTRSAIKLGIDHKLLWTSFKFSIYSK